MADGGLPSAPPPNAAIAELRRLGMAPKRVARALGVEETHMRRIFLGRKPASQALRERAVALWPTVTLGMWSIPADVRGSQAARDLQTPRTPAGAPRTPAQLLTEGGLGAAEQQAAWGLELRRHQAAITSAVEAVSERDLVLGHVGYVATRRLVVELLAPDPALAAAVARAMPELEPGGPLDVLRAARGELEVLRAWLAEQSGVALQKLSLSHGNRLDAARTKADVLLQKAKLASTRTAELLKAGVWAEVTIGVCACMRGQAEALEDVIAELQAEIEQANPFAVALAAALASVRHITWPAKQYQNDPHAFFRDVLGVELYDKQTEILDDVRDHDWVAVRSGHRIGKSLLVGGIGLWFYCCFDRARVFLVAPTDHQLQDIDWREIRVRVLESGVCVGCRQANRDLDPMFQVKAPCPHSAKIDGILRETARAGLHSADGGMRHITGLSVRQPEAIQGLAGENVCFLVDEASGVAQPIMTAIKGNLAGGGKFLLFANPTQPEGELHDAFYPKKDPETGLAESLFRTHTVSSWDSPNARAGLRKGDPGFIPGLATLEWCEARKREWGEDSEEYHVRVLGIHFQGGTSRLLSVQLLIEAESRWENGAADDEVGELTIGIDPCGAEGSGDDGGFAARRGFRMLEVLGRPGPLTAKQHLAEALSIHQRHARNPRERMTVVIDVEGVGVGVASEFRAWASNNPSRMRVVTVRSSSNASYEPHIYDRQRDALAGHFAMWLKQGGAIPGDLILNGDLRALAMKLQVTPKGERLKLKPKAEIRKDIKRSPDRYDACALAAWGDRNAEAFDDDEDTEASAAEALANGYGSSGPALDPYAGSVDPYAR